MRHRLYLETSFWKRLADPANPEMRRASYAFLRAIETRDRILVSSLVRHELWRTPDPDERKLLFRRLRRVRARTLTPNSRIRQLAQEFRDLGGWGEGMVADALHVGYAVFSRADAIVSWDRDDLARDRTRRVLGTLGRMREIPVPRLGTPEEVAGWLGIRTR
jgi:predicted nucleic acid-binding protein